MGVPARCHAELVEAHRSAFRNNLLLITKIYFHVEMLFWHSVFPLKK